MTLRIFNTLTKKKELFETLEPGKVLMYVCGPTVYADAHIGHAMSVVVFDVIRRYLEHMGYDVRHVMNYTDVDDKIILRAAELRVDPFELAESYIRKFDHHLNQLNVLKAHVNPKATGEIEHIIEMDEKLIEKGFAYESGGDVFFRVTRDEDYGRLSGRKLEDMQAGARIDIDTKKENPLDFVIWKSAKKGEPYWDSPWGQGRPGWHIECSAMSSFHLGDQIDIHGGGTDLIFPHHENEIAQSESITGKPFSRYWVHNGMLQLAGEKMSKSLGNLVTIDEFFSKYEPDVFRLLVLNSSYRSPLSYNDEIVEQAERGLQRLRSGLKPARKAGEPDPEAESALLSQVEITQQGFHAAMQDDFNTAAGLAQLYDLVRAINQGRDRGLAENELEKAQETLLDLASILGLRLAVASETNQGADPFISLLLEIRQSLREAKQWQLADRIREKLQELGVIVEDNQDGSSWFWD